MSTLTDVDLEACESALTKMQEILDSMEAQSGPCPEIEILRKQMQTVHQYCSLVSTSLACRNVHLDTTDPESEARRLVENIPLEEIFQHEELANMFLSELLLAISSAKTDHTRRERQKKGIDAARARGVQFGKRRLDLPENFDDVRHAWRNGECSLKDAARLCEMPRSTFRSIVLRLEQEELTEKPAQTA